MRSDGLKCTSSTLLVSIFCLVSREYSGFLCDDNSDGRTQCTELAKSPVYKVGMGAVLVEMHRLADLLSPALSRRSNIITDNPSLGYMLTCTKYSRRRSIVVRRYVVSCIQDLYTRYANEIIIPSLLRSKLVAQSKRSVDEQNIRIASGRARDGVCDYHFPRPAVSAEMRTLLCQVSKNNRRSTAFVVAVLLRADPSARCIVHVQRNNIVQKRARDARRAR